MKRICIVIFFLLMLIVLSGCKYDMDVWIDSDGGGKASITVSGAVMTTSADIKNHLTKKGFDNISVNEKGMGAFDVKMKWNDFNKSMGKRKTNEDGTIMLDFGKVDINSTITVHVPGNVVIDKTKGNIKNNNTVFFTGGQQAIIVYKPTRGIPIQTLILCSATALFLIIIIVFIIKHKKNKQIDSVNINKSIDNTDVSTNKITTEINSENIYCTNCGASLSHDSKYCIICGEKCDDN